MAKSEPKPVTKETLTSTKADGSVPTPDRGILVLAFFASALISALFTVELFAPGPIGIGGRFPSTGDIADRSYKAPFDITIVDRAATEEHQRAALEQAPVVYDFDERAGAGLRERIRAAFTAGRNARGTAGAEGSPVDPAAAFRAALEGPDDLPEDAVKRLVTSGFDLSKQGALIRLLEPLSTRMIAADLGEFERNAENRTVVVRALDSGEDRVLAEDAKVLSTRSARKQVAGDKGRALQGLKEPDGLAIAALAQALVRPNLNFNLRATDERKTIAREGVPEVTTSLRKGEIIVRDGEHVTERHVRVLLGIQEQVRTRSETQSFVAVWIIVLMLLWATWYFGTMSSTRFPTSFRDLNFLLLTLVVLAVGTKLTLFICDAVAASPGFVNFVEQAPVRLYYVVPFAAATMLVRMVHNAETAALFAVASSLLFGLQLGDIAFAMYGLTGSLVAAVGSARVTQRGTLLRTGARVGVASMMMILALELLRGNPSWIPLAIELSAGFAGGCLAGGLATAFAPVVEGLFQYTTDVRLVELANREQPLLRELEIQAPGTYHHSMMVGHLAEKAAETIGANALLAKVGGYYHDIGKMRRPHFFVENVTVHRGENRHEKLSPSMSARIIQAHVKDGLELGRQSKLAPAIMRGIGEHHGTSIIRFFYEKAKEQLDPEKGEQVEEHEYRYPGPKPQTREAGILMLADSVEAASRTLADTSPARVQQLVQRIINNYFRDGQLDECSLTLRDLHAIARSFIDTLSAIRHERIDYPEASDAEKRRTEETVDEGVVERLEPKGKDRSEAAASSRDDDLKRLGLP